jgi:adenylate cyclase class 2
MMEIEVKVQVPDHAPFHNRLTVLGASFVSREHQRDVYFNASDRDFARTDEALRVRHEGPRTILTYKGPKEAGSGYKARKEVNVQVDVGSAIEELLTAVGFSPSAEVRKLREEYRLRGVSVALDTVEDLGFFVEIEVCTAEGTESAMEVISDVQKEIGLEGPHIRESYLELLEATRSGARS